MSFFYLDVVLGSLALFLLQHFISARRRTNPLPPGPKGLPLLGNLNDVPSEKPWLTFAKWGELYGDISSVTILGQTIVVLNSVRVAVDMLDKKGAIYSERPVFPMCGELVGWQNALVFLQYGDRFKSFRKTFHNLIGTNAVMKKYCPAEELETKRFLRRVLATPELLAEHIRKSTGAIVLRISHGYEIEEENDPLIRLADEAMEHFSACSTAGAFLVDVIPALKYIPEWMPGAGFKRMAREYAHTLSQMVDQPFQFVKQQVAAGTALTSFTSSALEAGNLSPKETFDLKWQAASLYSGGADTTVSAIHALFLALSLHPEIAERAQAEIEAVVGHDRLPTFADREHLPYINALQKEVLRWNSVAPTGVPHRTRQDDIHEGFFIPKGSLIVPNIWKMTHDAATYKSPMQFNPDRFIGSQAEPDPRDICFGFGRRICPGILLADASLWIACAVSIAVLDIAPGVDEAGNILKADVDPVTGHEQTSGTVSHPKPFPCKITARSERAVELIMEDD
ncbi:cytochrome P450 [Cylindrobasidium torrendii FP15055 ss-10]|uniref:Cytochrome P450 n=1 Tax=Cylindrobasidium torrendii FP15055 ss-10 TaxID=1314674 RepID=A0A0D7B9X5_9AGAR|nr:cytochrome P450 [Cylindrobasidium torrendii FP15055 ss-10]